VYQLLYDAPDVLPILRSFGDVSGRVASAEQDMRRMRQELEVIKGDAASAKSMQAHMRRLEERNAELVRSLAARSTGARAPHRRDGASRDRLAVEWERRAEGEGQVGDLAPSSGLEWSVEQEPSLFFSPVASALCLACLARGLWRVQEEHLDEKVAEAVASKEKEMQQSMGLADTRQQALRQQIQDLHQTVSALQVWPPPLLLTAPLHAFGTLCLRSGISEVPHPGI